MKLATRVSTTVAVGIAFLLVPGCPGIFPGEMTDIGTPAPCSNDADCPEGIACIFPNGMDQMGICDVDETQVSTGTPAPCDADEDCPEDIGCIFPNGTDQPGICDLEETQAP